VVVPARLAFPKRATFFRPQGNVFNAGPHALHIDAAEVSKKRAGETGAGILRASGLSPFASNLTSLISCPTSGTEVESVGIASEFPNNITLKMRDSKDRNRVAGLHAVLYCFEIVPTTCRGDRSNRSSVGPSLLSPCLLRPQAFRRSSAAVLSGSGYQRGMNCKREPWAR
jgi:hypothetical protein